MKTTGGKNIVIRDYAEKDLDFVIGRHRELYDSEYGLVPEVFGNYVEKYVLEFHQSHTDREHMWIAEMEGENKPVGTIAIVHADDGSAQLRWFLIEPETRGTGLGHRLVRTALDFCREKGYRHVFLWTLSNLDAARHLYGKYGFTLTERKPNDAWAGNLVEERWDLDLTPAEFFVNDDALWEELGGGMRRKILPWANGLMAVYVRFDKGAVGSPHAHDVHTQIAYVAAGRFEAELGGTKKTLKAGDAFFAPPGSSHGVVALEDGSVILDIFNPAREDFVKK